MRERFPHISKFGQLVTGSIVLTAVAAMLVVAAGCSSTDSVKSGASVPTGTAMFPVGITAFAFTDGSRPVPATISQPGAAERFLQVRVWYPGVAPSPAEAVDDNFNSIPSPTPMFDENPATASGPFPLIVLAHDLGSTPALYGDLAAAWAGAGFVVAAPSFPLSDAYAPGGPNGSDSINQPGDVRAVIDRILELSDADDGGILAGMIDPSSIGIVGHGVGAGTAAVLFANPCCLDERIGALMVMSPGTNDYMSGTVEWPENRPLLVVHGDADVVAPKMLGDEMFAGASAPKGLLTLLGIDHDSYIVRSSPAFAVTAKTTTDFWRIYLDGAPGTVGSVSGDYVPGVATLVFVTD